MKSKKRKIFNWIKIIVFFYCSIGIALYYLQEKFLFHPTPLPADHKFNFTGKFNEMMIPINAKDNINVVRFLPEYGVSRGVVLFFHGNRGNVERYAKYAPMFTQKGYECWMADYPGFGKSTGNRSEKALYEQAYQIYRLAKSKFGMDSIIIYGKSFGTGIASFLTSETKPRLLVLETPYRSIPSLFGHYAFIYPVNAMVNYKLPVEEYLQDIKIPVVIFHGTDDGVIPYGYAKKLQPYLKPGDQFVTIEAGSHHNLAGYPKYKAAMDSLLR
jgi:pimeloyl-ACP methyl ester carboxylesterase